MTTTVDARGARARFSELLDRASLGETISITRRDSRMPPDAPALPRGTSASEPSIRSAAPPDPAGSAAFER